MLPCSLFELQASTMATKSQRQKERGSAVSSLNAAIEAMNHVESVSNIPPAKFCEHPSHYDRGGFPQSYPGVGNGLLHVVVIESGLALTQGISSEGGRRVVVWAEVGDNPRV